MTNEEKLKKLLQIATDNGYKSYYPISDCWLIDGRDKLFTIEGLTISCDVTGEPNCLELSINDIVLDWSNDSICFLDALCEAFLEKVLKKEIQPEYSKKRLDIAVKWISKPTNERLDFLFNEFSNLLN